MFHIYKDIIVEGWDGSSKTVRIWAPLWFMGEVEEFAL